MRLTADLINSSNSYLNALKQRELDLRGHKIPSIENLGVAKEQDAIDLTDNDIAALANFPLSPRLQALYCARNRIGTIQSGLAKSIPNLKTLVLTQNQLSELADLDPLQSFPKLTHLSIIENPVTSKENYRYWVLWRCPTVRFLDFQKVKEAERNKATELFGTTAAPTELAQQIISIRSNRPAASFAASTPATNGIDKRFRVQLTDQEKKRVEQMVRNAKTLAEIARIEKDISEGRIPGGIAEENDMNTA